MNHETNQVADQPSATSQVADSICDADPPARFYELRNLANIMDAGTAAALALRTPGMLGVVKYMAARGDSLRQVCELLNLTYSDLQQVLDTEPTSQDRF